MFIELKECIAPGRRNFFLHEAVIRMSKFKHSKTFRHGTKFETCYQKHI